MIKKIKNFFRENIRLKKREVILLKKQVALLNSLKKEIIDIKNSSLRTIENVAANEIISEVKDVFSKRQLSYLDTLKVIKDEKLNFVRFGDGELQQIFRDEYNQGFQKHDKELSKILLEALNNSAENNCLLGLAKVLEDKYSLGTWASIWRDLKPFALKYERFGNAHITRPAFFISQGETGVKYWRNIWDGLSITVVSGSNSRFELIPELFDNVKSSDFIYGKSINAFDEFSNLVEQCKNTSSDLILVALGPTGTALTYELSKFGKWVIDVGHINKSYEFALKGGVYPEKTPIKQ